VTDPLAREQVMQVVDAAARLVFEGHDQIARPYTRLRCGAVRDDFQQYNVLGRQRTCCGRLQGRKAMRPLKAVVKTLFLPIACLALVAWVAIFVLIFIMLPNRNVGIATLIVISGVVLAFPWMGLVMGLLRRLHADDTPTEDQDNKS